MEKRLRHMLAVAIGLVHSLGEGVDRRMAAFHRAVLLIVFAVAAGRSVYGFLQSQSAGGAADTDQVAWVYLLLAIITALSLVAHDRLPAFRTSAFALPTLALGASFLLLDYRTRLGWIIVIGTAVAATPLIVYELLRACARREVDVPENGEIADKS